MRIENIWKTKYNEYAEEMKIARELMEKWKRNK